ncbi:MAG: DUF1573 domain-containing protein [Polyangiaceae bacterium]
MRRGVALALLGLIFGCEKREAPSSAAPSAAPRLVIEKASHDFGQVSLGARVTAEFVLRNAGTAPLDVGQVAEVMGCGGSVEPKRLGPAQSGRLAVWCQPSVKGPLGVSLRVPSNDAEVHEVALNGQVLPRLGLERTVLGFVLHAGEERSEDVRLLGDRLAEARLSVVESGPAGCKAELASGALRVTCRGGAPGLGSGDVVLTTGLDEPARLTLPCTLDVRGDIKVSPTNPYFNLRTSGPKQVLLELQSAREDFQVSRVEVVDGAFSAKLEQVGAHAYRVDLRVDEARISPQDRSALGTLRIFSNDPSEPQKDVPLSAFGVPNLAQSAP